MERFVMLKLRVANKDDFADQHGNKKLGTVYFHKQVTGAIEKKANYFTENTDMKTFKKLYANNQIFVMVEPNEVHVLEENE